LTDFLKELALVFRGVVMRLRELIIWILLSVGAIIATVVILSLGNDGGRFILLCITVPVSLSIILPIGGLVLDIFTARAKSNTNKNFGSIVKQLTNSNINIRRDAAKKLSLFGDERVDEPLKAALTDTDLEVRLHAGNRLVKSESTLVNSALNDSIAGLSTTLPSVPQEKRRDIVGLLSKMRRRLSLAVEDIPVLSYCEICFQRPGASVIIYYGDHSRVEQKVSGGTLEKITHPPALRGAMTVLICEECGKGEPERTAIGIKTSMSSHLDEHIDTLTSFCCTKKEAVERFGKARVEDIKPRPPYYQD
jgi:hypothetical protein